MRWYRQAEALLPASGYDATLPALYEDVARLYMLMNMPRPALRALERALSHATVAEGSYRWARLRLEQADAWLRLRRPAQARPLLAGVLPIFRQIGHMRPVAQTQTLLGRTATLEGNVNEAAAHYCAALESWLGIDDGEAQTEVAHEMETLAGFATLPVQPSSVLTSAAANVRVRVYAQRFIHPLYAMFSRVGFLVLAGLLFFLLFFGIRTQSGTSIRADAALTYVPPTQANTAAAEFSPNLPPIQLPISQQLSPDLNTQVVGTLFGGGLLLYLLLYTVLGLYLIIYAPLAPVQREQQQRWVLGDDAIEHVAAGKTLARLPWQSVSLWLRSNRCFWREPMAQFSFCALQGGETTLIIPGRTRHYRGLQRVIDARLPGHARHDDSGYRLIGSKEGVIFGATIFYLMLFVFVASVAKEWLLSPLLGTPYTLADLYALGYLGLAYPLGYWLVVQPTRALLTVEGSRSILGGVGAVGVGMALISLLHLNWLRLPVGRPEIIIQFIAVYLILFAAFRIWRARPPIYLTSARQLYRALIHWGMDLLLLILVGLMLQLIVVELRSFHHMVVGNGYLRQADVEVRRFAAAARLESLYTSARRAYERSLNLRESAVVHNSLGSVYAQLNAPAAAVRNYKAALDLEANPVYQINLAMAYATWSRQTDNPEKQVAYAKQGADLFDSLIAKMQTSGESQTQLALTYLLRATLHFNQDAYAAAYDDFSAAIASDPDANDNYIGPQAYMGRAWANFQMNELRGNLAAWSEEEVTEKRTRIARCPGRFPRRRSSRPWQSKRPRWRRLDALLPGHQISGV